MVLVTFPFFFGKPRYAFVDQDESSLGIAAVEADGAAVTAFETAVVREVIRSKLEEVQRCYADWLNQNLPLEGTVGVGFAIGPDGVVSSVQVTNDKLPFSACLLDSIADWRFPKLESGKKLVVTYSYLFKISEAQ